MGELQRRVSLRPGLTIALGLVLGLVVSATLLWMLAELTDEVLEGESRRFDRAVLLWIDANSPAWLGEPMRAVTALGYYRVVVPLAAIAACLFYRAGDRASAALLVLSTVGGILLTTLLKTTFQRQRPTFVDSGYEASFFSFPSGHATVSISFYGALALLLALRLGNPWRAVALIAGAVWALLVGFSRLYLGVHYPTDVLAGYLSSLTWLAFVLLAWLLWRLPGAPRRLAAGRGRKPSG